MSSPNTLWLVGLPRRKSSLSIDGRSSWMSDMVCTISMAHAVGIAVETSPAQHTAAGIGVPCSNRVMQVWVRVRVRVPRARLHKMKRELNQAVVVAGS
jgi:hypothetical protein